MGEGGFHYLPPIRGLVARATVGAIVWHADLVRLIGCRLDGPGGPRTAERVEATEMGTVVRWRLQDGTELVQQLQEAWAWTRSAKPLQGGDQPHGTHRPTT